jgi:alpha-L-fucosidase
MNIKKHLLVFFILLFSGYLIAQVKYEANWESLSNHQPVPEWLRDAKFGIYTHWGVYSVPAYNNEHYYRTMHHNEGYSKHGTYQRHRALYGDLDEFGYHDFIPMFKGENFDADEWADLYVKSGARFAGLVAEHHDGFAMWDSEFTPFNSKNMGPQKDVTGLLEKAIKKRGMKFFTSLHHSFNFTALEIKEGWAADDPKYEKLYGSMMDREAWFEMWLNKCNEVADKYHPDIMYFDAWLDDIPEEYIKQYLAHYFNEAEANGQEVAVTYKGDDLPREVGMLDHENKSPDEFMEEPWLCDFSIGTGISYAWGYTEGMQNRTPKDIVRTLVDVVSKNGQMLLNLSPMSDGTIPQDQKNVVHRVGRWMWSHGEAIYETRPFDVSHEITSGGLDVFYTRKDKNIYAIFYEWPGLNTPIKLKEVLPERVDGEIIAVTLLGLKKLDDCTFSHGEDGLEFSIPKARIPDDLAIVFRIEVE